MKKNEWCEFVSSAVDQSFEGIAFADMDNKLIYVNPSWAKMHHYDSPEELIGASITIFHNQEQLETSVWPFIQEVLEKGQKTGEVRHIRKDGTPFITLMTTTLLKDAHEKPIAILGIAKDITERIEIEKALKAEKQRLVESQRIAKIGSWEHNITSNEVFWSEEIYHMFGLDPKSDIGNIDIFFNILHPDDRPKVTKFLEEILKDKQLKEHFEIEYRINLKDGSTRTFQAHVKLAPDSCGKMNMLVGTIQDITERKKIEEELLQSHNNLEELVAKRTAELEQKTLHLEELNVALKVLLRKQQEDKKEIGKKFLQKLETIVFPYIDELKKRLPASYEKAFVEIIESNLKEIISPFPYDLSSKLSKLTPAEIQIADLIRKNKTSKEIALLLNLSPTTVSTHRQNIRKKLNLTNQKLNLQTILGTSSM